MELPNLAPKSGGIFATEPITAWVNGNPPPPLATRESIVDFAFVNYSPVNVDASFVTNFYIDGLLYRSEEFQFHSTDYGNANGWGRTFYLPAGTLEPGVHTFTMVIDANDDIEEANENDNVFTNKIEWLAEFPPAPTPTTYSTADLRTAIAPLTNTFFNDHRTVHDLAENDRRIKDKIFAIADAAFYYATGTALKDKDWGFHLMTRDEFAYIRISECIGVLDDARQVDFDYKVDYCDGTYRAPDAHVRYSIRPEIYVPIDHPPAEILSTFFHEIGHALANQTKYQNGDRDPRIYRGVLEAEAQTFEAVMWRAIEEILQTDFGDLPDTQQNSDLISDFIDHWTTEGRRYQEHGLGYLFMWLNIFQDPMNLGLAQDITDDGHLSFAASKAVYDTLLTWNHNQVVDWGEGLLNAETDELQSYKNIALDRLANEPQQDPDKRFDFEAHRTFFLSP